MKPVLTKIIALLMLSGLAQPGFSFDMIRDANAKVFTQKVDHSKDGKRPVTNLMMKRPANYPGNDAVKK
jgi:hypothetical protein